jgi:fatty acid desaturase
MANIPHANQYKNFNSKPVNQSQPNDTQKTTAAEEESAASGVLFIAAIVTLFLGQFLLALMLFIVGVLFSLAEDK